MRSFSKRTGFIVDAGASFQMGHDATLRFDKEKLSDVSRIASNLPKTLKAESIAFKSLRAE
jgi:hypothetical protein